MNHSNLTLWFESGSAADIHLPDPAFWNGGGTNAYVAQYEFFDFSNPDEGIFLERLTYPLYEADYDFSDEKPQSAWEVLKQRFLLVPPEELVNVTLVVYQGIAVLERDYNSPFNCHLRVSSAEGFKNPDTN